ncbi:MAG: NfeD family protein [Bacteroidaceae bacterium]|nr:NfeD family protein [Bacteroidaceae bacterium]
MELMIIALLILLGVVLLAVEIALIPGIGITGIIGTLSLISSICYAFVCINNLAGWITTAIVVAILVILFTWAVYGKSIDKVALKKKLNSTVENPEIKDLKPGDEGVAIARLALIGEAEFKGKRVEVRSRDGFINEGTPIVIVNVNGNEIAVEKKK